MDIKEAMAIIKDLSDGLDPETKQPLSTNSIYQRPSIIRALCKAVEFIDRINQRSERKSRLPDNAGKPWTLSEDEELRREFHSANEFNVIARKHNRTRGAIVSRLVKLGEIKPTVAPQTAA